MTALSLRDVVVMRGNRRVIDRVSLHIGSGDRIALIGPNGSGKTTLLRTLLGLQRLSGGAVTVDGIPTAALSPKQRAARLAWLPQQALADEAISTLDYVATARFRFAESKTQANAQSLQALRRVGAHAWAARLVTQLSGGEQQRVALAAMLAQESDIFLADEPANHLDPAQQMGVWKLLGQVADSRTVMVVTHDVNWLHWLGPLQGTRVVALKEGKLVFDVRADDTTLAAKLSGLYGMELLAYPIGDFRFVIPAGPASDSV